MLLLGLGAGIAFNPILLAAMSDVAPEESGLASGLVNTAFMMGGALGLAVLASLAASRTDTLTADGDSHLEALTGGYHSAFIVGALFAAGGRCDRRARAAHRPPAGRRARRRARHRDAHPRRGVLAPQHAGPNVGFTHLGGLAPPGGV